jgi:hypothetical protein
LKNLPPTWSTIDIKKNILPIFFKNKARIYDIDSDVFIFENNVIVFLDGWRVLSPDEALQENDDNDNVLVE